MTPGIPLLGVVLFPPDMSGLLPLMSPGLALSPISLPTVVLFGIGGRELLSRTTEHSPVIGFSDWPSGQFEDALFSLLEVLSEHPERTNSKQREEEHNSGRSARRVRMTDASAVRS